MEVGFDEADQTGLLWGWVLGVIVLAALDPGHVQSSLMAQVRAGRGPLTQ